MRLRVQGFGGFGGLGGLGVSGVRGFGGLGVSGLGVSGLGLQGCSRRQGWLHLKPTQVLTASAQDPMSTCARASAHGTAFKVHFRFKLGAGP